MSLLPQNTLMHACIRCAKSVLTVFTTLVQFDLSLQHCIVSQHCLVESFFFEIIEIMETKMTCTWLLPARQQKGFPNMVKSHGLRGGCVYALLLSVPFA